MLFKDIVGQEVLKGRLIQSALAGRISHAQLFLGQSGYGALPLALAYVQFINCSNKLADDSCGSCKSCLKISKLAHPDLHFAFPVNTNKEVTKNPSSDLFIQQWREINADHPYFNLDDWHQKIAIETKQSIINVAESQEMIKKLSLKPYEAEYKFLLIWKAEQLNVQAANKLLKLIEEPTDKTIILLVAEEEEQMLKTIISRTQLIRVPPVKKEAIAEYLMQTAGVEVSLATEHASFAEGNVATALARLNQQEEVDYFFNLFKRWMRGCYEANIEKMYAWVEEVSARTIGREKQKRFLEFALEIMREGLMRNYVGTHLQRFDGEINSFMKNFAPFVHHSNVVAIMELLNLAHRDIGRNAYAKITFMDMSMKFANLLRVKKG